MESDPELLRRFVDTGSESAFETLVLRHVNLVYSAALRQTGDAHIAEDIVQTVFADLARKAGPLSHRPILVSWLYKSTRFAASKMLRSEYRRRAREKEALVMSDLLSSETNSDWERIRPILDDAICRLGEMEREAVLLRFFQAMPYLEIGRMLNISEELARQRVTRALDKMYATMKRRGITSTATAFAAMLATQGAIAAPAGLAAKVTSGVVAAGLLGGSASVGNTLFLMITTKSTATIMAAVALIAIGSAIYEANIAGDRSEMLAKANTDRADLQNRLAAATRQLNALTPGGGPLGGSSGLNSRQADRVKTPTGNSSPFAPEVEKVLDHPELRKLYLQKLALKTKADFGGFFASAGLTQAQLDAFAQLVTARESANLDLFASLKSQSLLSPDGLTPEGAQAAQALISKEAGKIAADFSLGMDDLLGTDINAQLKQYADGIGSRTAANQLAVQLASTNAPLTTQQTNQLAQIVSQQGLNPSAIDLSPSGRNPTILSALSGSAAGIPLDRTDALVIDQSFLEQQGSVAFITDAAIEKAKNVLNPDQLAALKVLQLQQVLQIKLAPAPTRK